VWHEPDGISASHGKRSTNGKSGLTSTARRACAIDPAAAPIAAIDPSGRRHQDSVPPPDVPLWSRQDRRLSEAIPPDRSGAVVSAPHSGPPRDEPPPQQSEASAHRQRWQRYEKPRPGYRLQLDVKLLERIPGTRARLYQFTTIDDCTRVRVLKVFDACNLHVIGQNTSFSSISLRHSEAVSPR
jgi:hypothetical protein